MASNKITPGRLLKGIRAAEEAGNLDDAKFLAGKLAKLRDSAIASREVESHMGAPASVRAAVGPSYRKESDRLETLKKYYPDATPYKDGNFAFTDPKTGKRTIYNPEGLDIGDIAEHGRSVAEFVGGGAGAIAGAPLGIPGVAGGAGLGAEAAGQVYDALQKMFGGMVDTRTLRQQALQATANIGAEAAGQRLGDMLPGILRNAVTGVRNRMRNTPPQMLDDLATEGIPLEGAAAMTGQGRILGTIQEVLTGLPGSAKVMEKATGKTLDTMEGRIKDVTRRLGGSATRAAGEPLTREAAGEVLQQGAKRAGQRFSSRVADLSRQLDDVAGDARVPVRNLAEVVEDMERRLAEAPNARAHLRKGIREGKRILRDVDEMGQVPFKALTDFRTNIGSKLERPDVSGYRGQEGNIVKDVWKAATKDVQRGANAIGPEADRLERLRTRYVRRMRGERIPLLDKIERKQVEDVLDYAMQKGRKGAFRISELKKNYTQDEWDDVVSSAVHHLGTPARSAQEWKLTSFFDNYKKLSPETQKTLLSTRKGRELKKEFDRLIRLTAGAKDVSDLQNWSKTAIHNHYIGILTNPMSLGGAAATAGGGYAFGGPEGAAIGLMTPYAVAKMMTSPKFVRWLGQSVANPETLPGGPSFGGHIGRLAAIAKAEPAIAEEIQQFVDALRPATQQQPREGTPGRQGMQQGAPMP